MPLRPRGGGRRERDWQSYADTYSGFSVVCRSHFRSVRLSGKAPAKRSPEIYFVVLLPFPGSRNRNRLGHVSVFSLAERLRFGSLLISATRAERPLALFLIAVVLAPLRFFGWAYWRAKSLAEGDSIKLQSAPQKMTYFG